MSMVINTNVMAINTQRNFANSTNGMAGAVEKLSSGLKINTGKDDPSGLSISEQLRSQKAGLERAKQNTAEAMNIMSIAEGAMSEMNNILKKMKALANHSASTGVTTPDQVAADQAEMDSAIQTIDRIAQTTMFAGENLINGNKEITYDQNTTIKATQNNKLVNARESSFSQIFKKNDFSVSIGFNGTAGAVDACGLGTRVNFSAQASKAYFEMDIGTSTHLSDLKTDGTAARDIQFTLTGNKGSRQFILGSGKHVSELVNSIKNSSDVTGVTAALTFNSAQDVTLNETDNADATQAGAIREAGEITVFNNANTVLTGANGGKGITSVTGPGAGNIKFGHNTDGQGNIYIKYTNDTTAELYKDAAMTAESLVGTATRDGATFTVTQANYSNLDGMAWDVVAGARNMFEAKGTYLSFGGIEGGEADGVTGSGDLFGATGAADTYFDKDNLYVSGVELGKNTSDEGEIFLKTVINDDQSATVYAYRHKDMKDEDLVAQGSYISGDMKIVLNEARNGEDAAGTGLGIVINIQAGETLPDPADNTTSTKNSRLQFTNLGARIYAEDYGEDAYVKVVQDKGEGLSYYNNQGSFASRKIVQLGETVKQSGQDATLSINGRQVKTEGLRLRMATQDIQADFSFNEGKVGSTTLAQVGYGAGSIFTKNGALTLGENDADEYDGTDFANLSGFVANAGHSTTEKMENFEGGMQLQIGDGPSSSNRTVVGIKSMTSENLGRISKTGLFDPDGKPIYTTKTFSLKDMFGGGEASLSQNPTLAMEMSSPSPMSRA